MLGSPGALFVEVKEQTDAYYCLPDPCMALAAAIAIQLTFEVPIGLGVMASSIGMVAAFVLCLPVGVYLLP